MEPCNTSAMVQAYSTHAAGGSPHSGALMLLVQYCANDGNRAEVLASFRGALEPLRALLKVRRLPCFPVNPGTCT